MIDEIRRLDLVVRGREIQRLRRERYGSAYLGEPDLTPAELERKHILCYPDEERRAWMRRQMARWLSEDE